MRYKKIVSTMLVIMLSGTMVIPVVTAATEVGIASEDITDPYADDYFHLIAKEKLLPYSYENKDVENEMTLLIDRTEELKTKYSTADAIAILNELQNLMGSITESDYENEYAMIHDENNYETGEYYKYKVSPTVWIVKNIIHCFSVYDANNIDEAKKAIDMIYDMALTEMKHGCHNDRLMQVIANLNKLSDRLPDEYSEYLNYVSGLAAKDSLIYENGKLPEDKIPSVVYEIDKNEQEEETVDAENGKLIEVDRTIETETVDAEYWENTNTIQSTKQNTSISYDTNSMDAYKKRMNEIENQGYVEVKEYSIKTIYYTLDKTTENPVWESTNIDLDTNEELDYSTFVVMLSSLSNKSKEFSFIEDSDMVMFIAEGQPLILNKVEKVAAEEIDILFDQFEKLGIKVALKKDEIDDDVTSLSDKLEAGDINEIVIDGKKLILTYKPILTKGIVQLPVEQVAEQIGFKVTQSGKTMTLTYKTEQDTENTIVMVAGSKYITVDEQKVALRTEITKQDDVIYAEFDKIAKVAGYTYSYDAKAGNLELEK